MSCFSSINETMAVVSCVRELSSECCQQRSESGNSPWVIDVDLEGNARSWVLRKPAIKIKTYYGRLKPSKCLKMLNGHKCLTIYLFYPIFLNPFS